MRLPPLNALRIFEAAARRQSFKLAAEELCVTPSAVSHAIQGLEDWLGTPLFERNRRGPCLTRAGRDYYPAVRDALHLIAVATDRVPGRRTSKQIRLSVCPTFASRVIMPRLAGFRELHPDISVLIGTAHRQVDLSRDDMDLAIRLGAGNWPGLDAEHLLTERLVPICSPEVKEQFRAIDDLSTLPLIHVTSVTQDWQAWADATGAGSIDPGRGLKVDTIQMAIDAAVRGLGIALGRRPLIDQELESGILVPFTEREIVSRTGYWLVGLPETMLRSEIRSFRDWLVRDLKFISSLTGAARVEKPARRRSGEARPAPVVGATT